MSNYRPYNSYQRYSNTQQHPNPYRAEQGPMGTLRHFVQQQPGIALVGAIVGGFLLARYLGERDAQRHATATSDHYRPMWTYAAEEPRHPAPPYRPMAQRPADHMGATEEQMSDQFADPSQSDLEDGTVGTTGRVYEMDPDGITAG